MSEDPLSEILGFDPATGERIEDRGQLKSIPPAEGATRLAVPEELQQKFHRHHTVTPESHFIPAGYEAGIVAPESLFFSQRRADGTTDRTYSIPNPDNRSNFSFPFIDMSQAQFVAGSKGYEPKLVRFHGEQGPIDQERSTLFFQNMISGLPKVSVDMYAQRRDMRVDYDEAGKLNKVHFMNYLGVFSDRGISLYEQDVQDALHKGNVELTTTGGRTFQLKHDRDKGRFTITRLDDGKTLDELSMPTSVDRQAIIADLFPDILLKDPLNAPANPDTDAWRSTTPLDAVGITWRRETETQ